MSKKARTVKTKKPTIEYYNIEEELEKYHYTTLSIISCDNNTFVKALNQNGQKVYILIDEDLTLNPNFILYKCSNCLVDYSQKIKVLNIVGMESYGIIYEHPKGLCFVYNSIADDSANLVVNEFNYELNEPMETNMLWYPVIRLSEIKLNNNVVLEALEGIIKHLRNDAYTTYMSSLNHLHQDIQYLNEDFAELMNAINDNIIKIKNKTDLVERNEMINQIITIMSKMSQYKNTIDNINYDINSYLDYFDKL